MECTEKGLIKGIAGSQDPKEAGNRKQGVNYLQNSPARASITQVSGLGPEPLPGGGWGRTGKLHSFNKHLLSTSCVPGTECTEGTDRDLCPRRVYLLVAMSLTRGPGSHDLPHGKRR